MWFPYGAGRWTWMHGGGADLPGGSPPPGGDVSADEPAHPPAGPGDGTPDETPVSAWEAVSIVVGLAALSGAVAAVVVTAFVVVLAWLAVTAVDEAPGERPPGTPPRRW